MALKKGLNIIAYSTLFFMVVLSINIASALGGISFVSPTPANATSTTSTNAEINISITNASDLNEFIWKWNNANFSFYDASLVLMFNFNNISAFGENETYAVDASRYGNNGILGNGTAGTQPTWTSNGRYSAALNFDGDGDSVGLPDSVILINTTKSAYSLEAWFKANGLSAINYIFEASGDSNFSYFALRAENTTLNFVYGNMTSVSVYSSQINLTTGMWYHAVVVVDPFLGSENIKIYLDNSLVAQFNDTRKDYYHDATIGARWTSSKGWNGTIDEIRILNRSLSQAEVQQHYYSNFYRFATGSWAFYASEQNLDIGTYTYKGKTINATGSSIETELRHLFIVAESIASTITKKKCSNECLSGERMCAGSGSYNICGDYDSDSCLEWSDVKNCADGMVCVEGACKQACKENWVCGEWHACENGKKSRACTDINACGTENSKPEESINCIAGISQQASISAEKITLSLFVAGIIIVAALIVAVALSKGKTEKMRRKALAQRIR